MGAVRLTWTTLYLDMHMCKWQLIPSMHTNERRHFDSDNNSSITLRLQCGRQIPRKSTLYATMRRAAAWPWVVFIATVLEFFIYFHGWDFEICEPSLLTQSQLQFSSTLFYHGTAALLYYLIYNVFMRTGGDLWNPSTKRLSLLGDVIKDRSFRRLSILR